MYGQETLKSDMFHKNSQFPKDLPITVLEFLRLKEEDNKKIKEILSSVLKKIFEHIHHDIRVLNTQLGSLSAENFRGY